MSARDARRAVNVIAKLSGKTLTVMVLRGETLKLFRCVALEEVTEEQILAVLQPPSLTSKTNWPRPPRN